jgi:hypothetical protein
MGYATLVMIGLWVAAVVACAAHLYRKEKAYAQRLRTVTTVQQLPWNRTKGG